MGRKYIATALVLATILLQTSCKKVFLGEGNTRVTGQVIDKFTGEPIPEAYVELLAGGKDSWYAPNIIDSITTDSEGKFDFKFYAYSDLNYSVRGSYYELYDNYNDLEVDLNDGWPNKNLTLELHPWGWVQTNFSNEPPLDPVMITSNFNDIKPLHAISSDTFTIGKRSGNRETDIVFWIQDHTGNISKLHDKKMFIPHDTIVINVKY